MIMPYTIKAECPCCGKRATGNNQIEELFGWRTPRDEKIPQSYCRDCRSAKCEAGVPCKCK